ncbi:hypothetical protein CDG79_03335 [Nostoc sp. 'Peltigera membranacea cyanobiont' 232]|nr:hypothetical protein CDG79_03335 [Nostoc sp. 'Peltigera membranacea cyanobiont' 232]
MSFFPDVFRGLPDPPKVRITNKAPNSPKPITSVFQPQNLVRYNTFTDFYFNGNVKFDSCNFSFDYEPQDSVLVNYPRIQYSLRNPLCSPEIKPQSPPNAAPNSFNVSPNGCNQSIVFSFIESNGKLIGGADKFEYFVDGGQTPFPNGTTQDGGGLDNIYTPSNTKFHYVPSSGFSSTITVRYLGLNGVSYLLYATAILYSDATLKASNGVIIPHFPLYQFNGNYVNAPWQIVNISTGSCIPSPIIYSPPPPPKKKDRKCMCCPGQQNNDALLKLVLKRIGSLPADVPTSYLTKNGVQPAQLKKVESLTEFIGWFAERLDETVGEFEITIDVDDADLSKEGKQKETIRLPNLAESIAEMFSMMIQSNINNELILNIVNRTLIESGQIKQSEFKTYSALNALIDYVGFHTTSQFQKMPLSFTVGEKSFDKFLKESEQDVSVLTYEQKETLTASMQSLLQAAAIIRAVNYRRTSGNKQKIASTIKNDLLGLLGETGNITDQVKTFITNIEKVYDAIDNKPN